MSQPFIGEIRMFAGNFAPAGYALTDGQLVQISQLQSLFSLIGTIYGGDGQTTFALPDLRSRVPIHFGSGPGLATRQLGEKGGSEQATISTNQIPVHTHPLQSTSAVGNSLTPGGKAIAPVGGLADAYIFDHDNPVQMAPEAISDHVGGGQPHDNVQPFAVVNFIIALTGTTPIMQS